MTNETVRKNVVELELDGVTAPDIDGWELGENLREDPSQVVVRVVNNTLVAEYLTHIVPRADIYEPELLPDAEESDVDNSPLRFYAYNAEAESIADRDVSRALSVEYGVHNVDGIGYEVWAFHNKSVGASE